MSEALYRIKKLKWGKKEPMINKGAFRITSKCCNGEYEIVNDEYGVVHWSYWSCNNRMNIFQIHCSSIADGKRKCQRHWENFLKEYLQKARSKNG